MVKGSKTLQLFGAPSVVARRVSVKGKPTDLYPRLLMEMSDVELPAWCMRQQLVMLLQDFVKSLHVQAV